MHASGPPKFIFPTGVPPLAYIALGVIFYPSFLLPNDPIGLVRARVRVKATLAIFVGLGRSIRITFISFFLLLLSI